MLKDLFISKTRVKLLETFLTDSTQMFHVRDMVRKTGDEINAVRRELKRMESSGLLKKENRELKEEIGGLKKEIKSHGPILKWYIQAQEGFKVAKAKKALINEE